MNYTETLVVTAGAGVAARYQVKCLENNARHARIGVGKSMGLRVVDWWTLVG